MEDGPQADPQDRRASPRPLRRRPPAGVQILEGQPQPRTLMGVPPQGEEAQLQPRTLIVERLEQEAEPLEVAGERRRLAAVPVVVRALEPVAVPKLFRKRSWTRQQGSSLVVCSVL